MEQTSVSKHKNSTMAKNLRNRVGISLPSLYNCWRASVGRVSRCRGQHAHTHKMQSKIIKRRNKKIEIQMPDEKWEQKYERYAVLYDANYRRLNECGPCQWWARYSVSASLCVCVCFFFTSDSLHKWEICIRQIASSRFRSNMKQKGRCLSVCV